MLSRGACLKASISHLKPLNADITPQSPCISHLEINLSAINKESVMAQQEFGGQQGARE